MYSSSSSNNATPRPLTTPFNGIPPLISTNQLSAALQRMQTKTGPIAIDTERANNYRYHDRAYLIQLKFGAPAKKEEIFLLDPLVIQTQISALQNILHTEWILHSASQDLPYLLPLGFSPTQIFDTEMAGLLLGFPKVGLQSLVAQTLGYHLAKEHSSADWSARPLPENMRAYAALDVELLHPLRAVLTTRLQETQRWEWFEQECTHILNSPLPTPNPEPWRRITSKLHIRDLRSIAILQKLWEAREHLAQAQDIPTHKVIDAEILGLLALAKPRSLADTKRARALRNRVLRQNAPYWWEAIKSAWEIPYSQLQPIRPNTSKSGFPTLPKWKEQRPDALFRLTQIRYALTMQAETLGIRAELLLRPAIQKQLAWEDWDSLTTFANRATELGARPWQISQTLTALQNFD